MNNETELSAALPRMTCPDDVLPEHLAEMMLHVPKGAVLQNSVRRLGHREFVFLLDQEQPAQSGLKHGDLFTLLCPTKFS